MTNLAIARRYAKALLAIGKEDKKAEAYKKELAAFVETLEKEKVLKHALINPLYGTEDRKKVLQKIMERMSLSKVVTSFLYLIFDKRRMAYLKDISEFYQRLTDDLANIARATVTSAAGLSSEAKKKIQDALAKMTGKKVIVDAQTDPSLIGGLVAKIGDLVFDGSIKTQLLTVQDIFKRGEKV